MTSSEPAPQRSPLIAVTGATGFLGSHLCLAALASGWRVRAVVRSPGRADWLTERGVQVHRADLADVDALRAGFDGVDAVVANAARVVARGGTYEDAARDNITGAANQAQACAEAGVRRLVYISSVAVVRPRLGRRLTEDAPIRDPDAPGRDLAEWTSSPTYARTKAAAERDLWACAEALGLEVTSVRPGPIYGPGPSRLNDRYRAWRRRRVVLAPTVRFPHAHVVDVARIVLRAIARPVAIARVFNAAGPSESPFTLLRHLRHVTGSGPRVLPMPVPFALSFDDGAADRLLGVALRAGRVGIADALIAEASDARAHALHHDGWTAQG